MRPIKGNPPPEWATALIERVCAGEGRREPRQVQWWHSKDAYSSGRYWDGEKRLHITAGTMELDQEMVLLHELGHHAWRKEMRHPPDNFLLPPAMLRQEAPPPRSRPTYACCTTMRDAGPLG